MYFDAKEFGKRLHDVRTSRGITQEELAVRLGLASKQHVICLLYTSTHPVIPSNAHTLRVSNFGELRLFFSLIPE